MRTLWKTAPAVPLAGGARCRLGRALLLLAVLVQAPQWARGQITPLEDVVPLAGLEIRTDDLIRTATSYADAVRELKTAELSVKTLQALRPAANVTDLEMQIACINVRTAEQKVRILRTIAESLLATAQARRDFLRRMEAGGQAPSPEAAPPAQSNPRLAQAEAAVRILEMILKIE